MRSAWFTKNPGDALLAGEALSQREADFLSTHKDPGGRNKLAIFIRHETEERLHCELKACFSPNTVGLARKVDVIPCTRPSRSGLSLLVDSQAACDAPLPSPKE